MKPVPLLFLMLGVEVSLAQCPKGDCRKSLPHALVPPALDEEGMAICAPLSPTTGNSSVFPLSGVWEGSVVNEGPGAGPNPVPYVTTIDIEPCTMNHETPCGSIKYGETGGSYGPVYYRREEACNSFSYSVFDGQCRYTPNPKP
jgi:hypothetical protein